MLRNFFLILLFSIILSSCQEEKEKKTTDPLRFEKERVERKAGTNCETEDFDCTIISLEVVKAKGAPEVSAEINEALVEHVISIISSEEDRKIENLEELSESFIADYKEAAENFSEEPPWEAYVNENIYFESDSLISVGVNTEIFTGGAHGYKILTFLNFNPQTGEEYTQKGLFSPEFKSFVEERFRREQNIPQDENINSTGFWFENNEFTLPENIGFAPDKVILVYNSYEIANYAAGDILMEIPMEEARPFLNIE